MLELAKPSPVSSAVSPIQIEAADWLPDLWAGGPGMREHTLAAVPHAHVHTYSMLCQYHVPRGLSVAGTVSIPNSLAGFAVPGWVLRESERVGLRPRRADATLCGRDRDT